MNWLSCFVHWIGIIVSVALLSFFSCLLLLCRNSFLLLVLVLIIGTWWNFNLVTKLHICSWLGLHTSHYFISVQYFINQLVERSWSIEEAIVDVRSFSRVYSYKVSSFLIFLEYISDILFLPEWSSFTHGLMNATIFLRVIVDILINKLVDLCSSILMEEITLPTWLQTSSLNAST